MSAVNAATGNLTSRQVSWLAVSLFVVSAPHVLHLPLWGTLLATALILWRIYLTRAGLELPHRAIVVFLVIATSGAVVLDYGTLLGRDAGVALLITMLTLKLLETRTRRDAMLIAFLSCFLVITSFLYSQTIPMALYMAICIWIITAGMIDVHYASPAKPGGALQAAGLMLAQSIPLMLVLFILFPRVQGPLWGSGAEPPRTTGLSDTMTPGSVSKLSLSDEVAFRVSFKGQTPEPRHLYWRGPVLTDYDGRTWHAPPFDFRRPVYNTRYLPVEYTVTVEPHGRPWLFAIDLPGTLPPNAVASQDMQILALHPVTTPTQYSMVSFLDYRYGWDESSSALQRALRLPPAFNPKTVALARSLRERYPDEQAFMQAVLTLFHEQGFAYTLAPPLLGEHSVDEFLFDTKSGFCEHYASALAVIMRAAGIPARIVTGYQGGEVNPIGGYLIVRQADAHAWTEVWLRERGWIRVDPTAAVAPARIEHGAASAAETGDAFNFFIRGDFPGLRELRFAWDSVANTWNQWVPGYSSDRQRILLTKFGVSDRSWQALSGALFVASAMVTLVLALGLLRRFEKRTRDPVATAYTTFCRKLGSIGLPRLANEGPVAYAERISVLRPDLEPAVRTFLTLYAGMRYGNSTDAAGVTRLYALARSFDPAARDQYRTRKAAKPAPMSNLP